MVTVMCVSLIMMNIALLQVLNHIRPILIGITLGLMSKSYFKCYMHQSIWYFGCQFKHRAIAIYICGCVTNRSIEVLSF